MNQQYEYLIIGAGPAGLQLGYFMEQCDRNYLILEAGAAPGTSFKAYPRHRTLISINKRYTGYDDPEINLRWDWNSLLCDNEQLLFKHYSREYFPHADALVDYLNDFAESYQLNIQYGVRVETISKDQGFTVTDAQGNVYTCQRLIIATGFSQPYVPDIPGIELAENYTEISTDQEDYINQRVLILGKGNSGFETADSLINTAAVIHVASPTSLTMAWQSKYVGHLRAVNNNFLDTYQLKSQNAVIDGTITQIRRQGDQLAVTIDYAHAQGEQEELLYDRVIVCTGFRFDDRMFDASCKPELAINDRFPKQTSEWESTNIQDLYFAGVLMHMRDFKKKQSGFIHGFRYNIRTLHHLLEQKYHYRPLPHAEIAATPTDLTAAFLKRINTSSGLWQQTGFLMDLVAVDEDGQTAQYFYELPKAYIHESGWATHSHYYTLSLEFGEAVGQIANPFASDRIHKDNVAAAAQSDFLHPVIRQYRGTELVAEHHIIEDLEAEWVEPVHIEPLKAFFTQHLASTLSQQTATELVMA